MLVFLVVATNLLAALAGVQFILAFGVQWQLSWLPGFVEPLLIGGGRTKWYASPEVWDEVEGLQRYVAALAAHDLHASTNVSAIACFGLAAQSRVFSTGMFSVHLHNTTRVPCAINSC